MKKKQAPERTCFSVTLLCVLCRKLLRSDSTSGASALASAAVNAGTCIHNSHAAVNRNSANRASALASAAAYTSIRNLMCHNTNSPFDPCQKNFKRSALARPQPASRKSLLTWIVTKQK